MAGLILALSSFNVEYSQEARMYSLIVVLALFSMYFLLRLSQNSSLTISIGYVISTTLMVYTHPYGWFVLAAQNIYVITLLVLSKDHTFRMRHWVILQGIVIALFAPWIPFLARQTSRVVVGPDGNFRHCLWYRDRTAYSKQCCSNILGIRWKRVVAGALSGIVSSLLVYKQ